MRMLTGGTTWVRAATNGVSVSQRIRLTA
jgi:hypothetical protein